MILDELPVYDALAHADLFATISLISGRLENLARTAYCAIDDERQAEEKQRYRLLTEKARQLLQMVEEMVPPHSWSCAQHGNNPQCLEPCRTPHGGSTFSMIAFAMDRPPPYLSAITRSSDLSDADRYDACVLLDRMTAHERFLYPRPLPTTPWYGHLDTFPCNGEELRTAPAGRGIFPARHPHPFAHGLAQHGGAAREHACLCELVRKGVSAIMRELSSSLTRVHTCFVQLTRYWFHKKQESGGKCMKNKIPAEREELAGTVTSFRQ